MTLNKLFKTSEAYPYNAQDLDWARQRYTQIADLFCERSVYNHGLKPESVVLARRNGGLVMRLYDFKSIVYRQLISPRCIPRREHDVQMLTIRSVQKKFERILASIAAV